jgi:hypothetical protein
MHNQLVDGGNGAVCAGQKKEFTHIEHLGVENSGKTQGVGALLVAAAEHDQTALILVGQELDALDVLEWVEFLILLVEQDRVRLCQ